MPCFRAIIGDDETDSVPRRGWRITAPKGHEFEQNCATIIGLLLTIAPVEWLAGTQGQQAREKPKIGVKGDFGAGAFQKADPQGKRRQLNLQGAKPHPGDQTAFGDAKEYSYASAPVSQVQRLDLSRYYQGPRACHDRAGPAPFPYRTSRSSSSADGEKFHEEFFDNTQMLETMYAAIREQKRE